MDSEAGLADELVRQKQACERTETQRLALLKRLTMSQSEQRRPVLKAMNPVLAVNDLQKALTYYQDVLGFEVTWKWGAPPTRAGVARDGLELQLDGAKYGPPGPSVVYFIVSDVDQYYREVRERGATIATELGDRPFLMRDFRVLDPDGNKLGFGEPIPQ